LKTSPLCLISIIVLVISLTVGFIGCEKRPPQKRLPGARKPAQKEVIRPAEQQEAVGAGTPQRAASRQLVESGMVQLEAKNYELAAVRFQDAINVDPRNGAAYYYLALADFYLEQYDTAVGLLDKAEALLRHDERWMERIENLRATIVTDEEVDKEQSPQPI
jgi:tetratricopeptide (TPR) repeat protein